MLISAKSSLLVLIDVQQRLVPHMADAEMLIARSSCVIKAASIVGVPALACEQNPDKLGPTAPELRALLGPEIIVPKMSFSALSEPAFRDRLATRDVCQIVLMGIEAHICVLQSALQFIAAGYQVFVVADALASRRRESMRTAIVRMRANGCEIVTSEMVIFEWAQCAGTDVFRSLSQLVR